MNENILNNDEQFSNYGMGWTRDNPDHRDYTMKNEKVRGLMNKLKLEKSGAKKLKQSVDLREWCSPIENQGSLGSCTANAGAGLIEYFERRAFETYTNASRLFLYKVTRNLLDQTGDTGAYLRTTMGALAVFGVPPEKYWSYDISKFDEEPSSFLYSFARSYQALVYYRLDPPDISTSELLNKIKTNLSAGLPSMFGFTVYSSYSQTNSNGGKFPYPGPADSVAGGHAVVAVGYDDNMKIKNTDSGGIETKGAFLIRNSWGTGWGDEGYGWIPYKYVTEKLAVDWWSLVKSEYIDSGKFGL